MGSSGTIGLGFADTSPPLEGEYIGSSAERGHIPGWIWAEVKKREARLTLADEGRVWRYKGRTFRYKVVAVGLELWVLRRLRHGKG